MPTVVHSPDAVATTSEVNTGDNGLQTQVNLPAHVTFPETLPEQVTKYYDLPSASTFVTLRWLNLSRRSKFDRKSLTEDIGSTIRSPGTAQSRTKGNMHTKGAWSKNLANPANELKRRRTDDASDVEEENQPKSRKLANSANRHIDVNHTTPNCVRLPLATNEAQACTPQALRAERTIRQQYQYQARGLRQSGQRIILRVRPLEAKIIKPPKQESIADSDTVSSTSCSDDSTDEHQWHRDRIKMSEPKRPSLKLKLSTSVATPGNISLQSPLPQSAVRTPSIKLSFKPKASPDTPKSARGKKRDITTNGNSSGQKRKRQIGDDESGEPATKEPKRRLTLKTPITPAPTALKLKTRGKISKRQPGSGYDSELEDREVDPVILEGFVLRMPAGADCDYVRNAISNGTIGMPASHGGADVRVRLLDVNGRRGIMIVNGTQYATSVVDLPCIVEGMKSWDKKGWIKSMDVSQMMLVLGPCSTDDEAKSYPLPPDIDPQTYAYEHGLTAPMKWVRKRRFARTRRARVDDIESTERRVQQLIEADRKAISVQFQVLDHDPRQERDQYSGSDDDAEGDMDDGDYFTARNGYGNGLVETPGYLENSQAFEAEVGQEEVDEFERLLMEGDAAAAEVVQAPEMNGHPVTTKTTISLPVPLRDAGDVAVSSTSASPAPFSGAPTPAANAESQGAQSSDDEESGEDDDDDDDSNADDNDKDEDADDNLQQVKDRIADMEAKIREQTAALRSQKNLILRKKMATKIQALKDDVDMMKKQNGLNDGDDGDGGDN